MTLRGVCWSFLLIVLQVMGRCSIAFAEPAVGQVDVSWDGDFARAERLVDAEKFGEAATELASLRERGFAEGYSSFPSFSFRLFDRAALMAEGKRMTEAAFLVRQAVALSPQDSQVLFRASSFESVLGHRGAISYYIDGLRWFLASPTMIWAAVRNILLAVLVAGSLSLLFVSVIQLVCNIKRVIINATRKKSIYTRGFMGPLLLTAAMIAPLAGGLLVSVGCWCLVLSRFIKESRNLALIAAGFILAWALAIPVIETLSRQLVSPVSLAISHVSSGAYDSQDVSILEKAVPSYSHDPLVRFSAGMARFRAGDLAEAELHWRVLGEPNEVSRNRELSSAALHNLGVLRYYQGNFPEAKKFIERSIEAIGSKSFEAAYDLSRVALAQLDTKLHDEEFGIARTLDASRLAELESQLNHSSSSESGALLTIQPSWTVFALRLLKPLPAGDLALATGPLKRDALISSLMTGAHSVWTLGVWGVFVLFCAWWSRKKGRRDFYHYRDGALEHSRIWALVPGGPFIAGTRPGVGLAVLTLVTALCMLALGEPRVFYWPVSQACSMESYLLLSAILLTLICSFGALWEAAAHNQSSKQMMGA